MAILKYYIYIVSDDETRIVTDELISLLKQKFDSVDAIFLSEKPEKKMVSTSTEFSPPQRKKHNVKRMRRTGW